jgi:hypothetical protein
MPKKPPFPIGLTVDEALQRGWRPGLGRKLFAGDDEIIREPGPGDGWIAPQPKRRRHSRYSDSPRARIRAVMERWEAAERERERKRKRKHNRYKKTAIKVRLLPAPEITIMSDQPITVEIEFTPGVLHGLRRRGFLTSLDFHGRESP